MKNAGSDIPEPAFLHPRRGADAVLMRGAYFEPRFCNSQRPFSPFRHADRRSVTS